MELKDFTKHSRRRRIFTILYIAAFLSYLIIGLQPANAETYEISGKLSIPSISLVSSVTALILEDHKLTTPDTIVGSYSRYKNKTLLIGHASTVFKNLFLITPGDLINYSGETYEVTSMVVLEKNVIDMDDILANTNDKTLIIMTCAGENLGGGDATHRLVVTATKKTFSI